MIRAVLDANVFVSAVLNPAGTPAQLYALWHAERFAVLISAAILEEVTRVLHYPKIAERHCWSEQQIQGFVGDIIALGISTPGALTLMVIQEDPPITGTWNVRSKGARMCWSRVIGSSSTSTNIKA